MECVFSVPVPCDRSEERQLVVAGTLSATDKYISVALEDGSLHIFSAAEGAYKLHVKDPSGHIIWAHAVVDEMLIIGRMDGTLQASSISDWAPLHQIPPSSSIADTALAHEDNRSPEAIRRLHILQLDPSGTSVSVLAATISGSLHQWTIGSASYRRSFRGGHDGTVFNVQSYDKGKRFVSAAPKGNTTAAWDVNTGTMLWQNRQDSPVYSLAISNGRAIVGRQDGGITILDLEDGAGIVAFKAHANLINSLNISQNRLISTATDGMAKMWLLFSSDMTFRLERSQQMYDLAVTSASMLKEWLVTAGKRAGEAQGICGLDMQLKLWAVHNEHSEPFVKVGIAVPRIWGLTRMGESESVAISTMKRGIPVLEVWRKI
ncbi:WD40 repeat-like protein [Myriangium duriaei CBS 260.36]|uniref:WD40 repeat-like protein n=1 Tax=Myriangium duriaei CBS 260.36 TaxID=1168546 RepID=A0A9P4IX48_9PEZI|nr:WD40 repeat-like protein [Myriangium duriaei CBS 260.36]